MPARRASRRESPGPNLPHVVITDIGLPLFDGFTFLRELRKLPPESGGAVPVIAVTACVTPEDRRKALQEVPDARGQAFCARDDRIGHRARGRPPGRVSREPHPKMRPQDPGLRVSCR